MARDVTVRKASVRIPLNDAVKVRVERVAELYGMPVATLCAVWIGQRVSQEEKGLGVAETISAGAVDALREMLGQQVELFDRAAAGGGTSDSAGG